MGSLSWKESVCSAFLIFPIILKLVWRNCQIRFIWRFLLKSESYLRFFPRSKVKEPSFTIVIQRFCCKSWLVTYYCYYTINFWNSVTKSSLMKHKTKIFVWRQKKKQVSWLENGYVMFYFCKFLTRKREKFLWIFVVVKLAVFLFCFLCYFVVLYFMSWNVHQ